MSSCLAAWCWQTFLLCHDVGMELRMPDLWHLKVNIHLKHLACVSQPSNKPGIVFPFAKGMQWNFCDFKNTSARSWRITALTKCWRNCLYDCISLVDFPSTMVWLPFAPFSSCVCVCVHICVDKLEKPFCTCCWEAIRTTPVSGLLYKFSLL